MGTIGRGDNGGEGSGGAILSPAYSIVQIPKQKFPLPAAGQRRMKKA